MSRIFFLKLSVISDIYAPNPLVFLRCGPGSGQEEVKTRVIVKEYLVSLKSRAMCMRVGN